MRNERQKLLTDAELRMLRVEAGKILRKPARNRDVGVTLTKIRTPSLAPLPWDDERDETASEGDAS
jgi:hypothetical protein